MEIKYISSNNDLRSIYPLLRELRTELTEENFLRFYHEAHNHDEFTIVAMLENGSAVGLMGYRVLYDFVHGKHLYIDDLVVANTARSRGIGAKLLKFAEKKAQEFGCARLRLCTGVTNESAKRFYEREDWKLRSVVYKKNS